MTSDANKEVYYDDLILPLKLWGGVDDGRCASRTPILPSTSKEEGKRKSVCCDSCQDGDLSPNENEDDKRTYYECPYCGFCFYLSIALKYHIKARHITERFYRCSYCEYSADILAQVRRHVREAHSLEKRHQCPYCKYKAKRSTHLRRHIEARHALGKKPRKSNSTLSSDEIKDEKPLFCAQCEFSTVIPRSLKRHIKQAHDNNTSQRCPQCDYTTNQLRELRHHIKVEHEKAKEYDCPCCEYRTVHLGSLKNHIMAKHTNEKGHKCPHCSYRAVQSGNLKRHIKTKHPNAGKKKVGKKQR